MLVTVIAGGKQILTANMVVMSDFVVWFRKILTAHSTRGRVVVVCLLCLSVSTCPGRRQVCRILSGFRASRVRNIYPLPHVHCIRWVGLVFGVFANAVASKATRCARWWRWWLLWHRHLRCGREMTWSRILDRKGDESEPHICEIPKRIFWLFRIGILHFLRWMALAVVDVAI